MAFNQGKVSFSFSKISKKPALPQQTETVKKIDKIEYINSIENNSLQIINAGSSDEKGPLVIPLQHPNLLLQSVIDTIKSRVSENLQEEDIHCENGSDQESSSVNKENSTSLQGNIITEQETLEEMAAREILEDAGKKNLKKRDAKNVTVPLATETTSDKQESTLDDYENIPVTDFGLAMLRGMGWDPKKGIGKNGKIVKVAGPALRPKGLGLGADKAMSSQKPVGKNVSEKEVLNKGSKVRITFGQYKNLYGTVEGFNDDVGRIDVLMAVTNEKVSMNECFVQLVTVEEFSKYSKVLNINAYNNYKEKESGKSLLSKHQEKEQVPQLSKLSHANDNSRKNGSDSPLSPKYSKDIKPSSSSSSKRDKHSKRCDSSSDTDDSHSRDNNKYKRKSPKDSHRHRRHRKSSSSSDSDSYGKRRKHKKSKKKKNRNRSRSR